MERGLTLARNLGRGTALLLSFAMMLAGGGCRKGDSSSSADFVAHPSPVGGKTGKGGGVQFVSLTFDDALAKAKTDQTLVMIDVYTDWCGWCTKLDKETFADARVGVATRGLVSIRVNAEKGGERVAQRYQVEGFPIVLFVDGSGTEVKRIRGFVNADDMLRAVQELPKKRA